MKKILFFVFLTIFGLNIYAQDVRFDDRNHGANRARTLGDPNQSYKRIFDYNYVERKPVFPRGKDTLNTYYLSNFSGFDSLAARCINNGDTAKYIRVHFEFTLDEYGTPYDGKFTYIGTTRYGSSSGDKKVKYFDDLKEYFQEAIKKMIQHTPSWKPALENNVRVQCSVKDSFQFWLGINPEQK